MVRQRTEAIKDRSHFKRKFIFKGLFYSSFLLFNKKSIENVPEP